MPDSAARPQDGTHSEGLGGNVLVSRGTPISKTIRQYRAASAANSDTRVHNEPGDALIANSSTLDTPAPSSHKRTDALGCSRPPTIT